MRQHGEQWTRGKVGDRFGSLTIESFVELTQRGFSWLCRCDCGGAAIRTTSALRRAVSCGTVPRCRVCGEVTNRARLAEYRDSRRQNYRAMWEAYGSLWSDRAVTNITAEIRDKVGDELGGWRAPAELPAEVMPALSGNAKVAGVPGGMTLKEVGDAIGLSRERVRQIEMRALAKLRKCPALREFWFGEVPGQQ